MNKQSEYTAQIKARYPDLEINRVHINHNGQYNDVLIVNDAYVFRFAKVPAAIDTLREEIAILRAMDGHLPLAIPVPLYSHVDTTTVGEVFMGYKMIRGQTLKWGAFAGHEDDPAVKTMAHQIGEFLHTLHHFDIRAALPGPIPIYDTLDSWHEMYEDFRMHLFSYMRPDARQEVTAHFETFFASQADMAFTPRLRHGDFGPENIVHDPERGVITGILDFGDVGLGDPATDFAGLYLSLGERFYRECATVYPAMLDAMDRIHFYAGTFALQEALFGFVNDDQDAFRAGMANYI